MSLKRAKPTTALAQVEVKRAESLHSRPCRAGKHVCSAALRCAVLYEAWACCGRPASYRIGFVQGMACALETAVVDQ
jgi:hypothetical protein